MDNNDFLDETTPDGFPQDEAAQDDITYGGDFPANGDEAARYGEDLSGTMQFESLDGADGIMPRDKFTDMNSTGGDVEKTRLMDSVQPEDGAEPPVPQYAAQNPVKKRRRKKKKKHRYNHTRTFGQIFLGVLLSVVAIGVGAFLAYRLIVAMMDFTGMAKASRQYEISITADKSVEQIADELYDNGIVEMPNLFKTYVNLFEDKDKFLNGNFVVKSNMSYGSIVATLQTIRTYSETVTVMIPEGSTAQDIGRLLEENYVCRAEDFEKFYKDKLEQYDFEEGIDTENRFYCLEGYLFPDTYNFWVVDDLKDNPNYDTAAYAKIAAEKMYNNFENKITRSMTARMEELGMTLDEVIILASLIQKEGTTEDNMSMISSVFHNRLNNPDRFPSLQSDTTYTYIQNCIDPVLRGGSGYDDIVLAYDTYQCEGLPAGAVCNPGLVAINAALYPAESSYYYFLASKDGAFYFAQTNEEHEQNIIDAELRGQGQEE